MDELKPIACPFCGARAGLHSRCEYAYVGCDECMAAGTPHESDAMAIAAWNRRAPIASAPAAGGGEARDAARYRWLRAMAPGEVNFDHTKDRSVGGYFKLFIEFDGKPFDPNDEAAEAAAFDAAVDAAIDAALASPGAEGRETL